MLRINPSGRSSRLFHTRLFIETGGVEFAGSRSPLTNCASDAPPVRFAKWRKFRARRQIRSVRTNEGNSGGGYARRMRINKMKRDKSLTKQRLNGVCETNRWNEFKSNSIVRSELFRTKLCTIFPPLSSIFGVSFALATRSWHVGAGRVADEKLVERASWC